MKNLAIYIGLLIFIIGCNNKEDIKIYKGYYLKLSISKIIDRLINMLYFSTFLFCFLPQTPKGAYYI